MVLSDTFACGNCSLHLFSGLFIKLVAVGALTGPGSDQRDNDLGRQCDNTAGIGNLNTEWTRTEDVAVDDPDNTYDDTQHHAVENGLLVRPLPEQKQGKGQTAYRAHCQRVGQDVHHIAGEQAEQLEQDSEYHNEHS